MPRGQTYPSESRSFTDRCTGASIRRVTDTECISHHPFYYLPCMDDEMRRLVFVSHRTGRPEIFAEDQDSGKIVQLTEREGLGEYSVHPSYDGRHVYFTARGIACRVDIERLWEEELVNFNADARGEGMVGAGMGTTSLSTDDRYWAVPVNAGENRMRLAVIDTANGDWEFITEHSSIGHPQFHPDDDTLLRFGGPYDERIWVLNRDGSDKRLAYDRRPSGDGRHYEWIVHETWRAGSKEIITSRWPRGCIGIDVESGAVREVCSFNAWHPAINREGTLMCADTNFPDRGLMLFDPLDGVGEPHLLCESKSSNVGAHWDTEYCPYDAGPIDVYAPQHTHPHPSFAPDGRSVVFTSDRTGCSQVYQVRIREDLEPAGSSS